MPLYDYGCIRCGHSKEIFLPLKDLDSPQYCSNCKTFDRQTPLKRLVSAPNIQMDIADYACPVTGKLISGRRQHEENLKRRGCRVLETGELEEAKKQRKAEDTKLEDEMGDTAVKIAASWAPEKQSKLWEELEHGAEAPLTRTTKKGD